MPDNIFHLSKSFSSTNNHTRDACDSTPYDSKYYNWNTYALIKNTLCIKSFAFSCAQRVNDVDSWTHHIALMHLLRWQYNPRAICYSHWGPVSQICFGNLNIIGSDNGLSSGRRQARIWINANLLSVGTFGRNSKLKSKLKHFLPRKCF